MKQVLRHKSYDAYNPEIGFFEEKSINTRNCGELKEFCVEKNISVGEILVINQLNAQIVQNNLK